MRKEAQPVYLVNHPPPPLSRPPFPLSLLPNEEHRGILSQNVLPWYIPALCLHKNWQPRNGSTPFRQSSFDAASAQNVYSFMPLPQTLSKETDARIACPS